MINKLSASNEPCPISFCTSMSLKNMNFYICVQILDKKWMVENICFETGIATLHDNLDSIIKKYNNIINLIIVILHAGQSFIRRILIEETASN